MKIHNYISQYDGKQYQVSRGTRNSIKRHKFGFRLLSKNLWHGLPWLWQLDTQDNIEDEPNCYTFFNSGKKRTIIRKKRMREANKYMNIKIKELIGFSKEKNVDSEDIKYFSTIMKAELFNLYNLKMKVSERIINKKLKRAFKRR